MGATGIEPMTSTVSILVAADYPVIPDTLNSTVPRRRLRFDVHSVRISNTPAQRVFGIELRHIPRHTAASIPFIREQRGHSRPTAFAVVCFHAGWFRPV